MKGTLARLGIGDFKHSLRQTAERLAGLRTPEGAGLPHNTLREGIARLPARRR
jgi:transposase